MKWVKLTDRKPDLGEPVSAKVSGGPAVGFYHIGYEGGCFEYVSLYSDDVVRAERFYTVEWLDEEDE